MKVACLRKKRVHSYLRCVKKKPKTKSVSRRKQTWDVNEFLTPTARVRQ